MRGYPKVLLSIIVVERRQQPRRISSLEYTNRAAGISMSVQEIHVEDTTIPDFFGEIWVS